MQYSCVAAPVEWTRGVQAGLTPSTCVLELIDGLTKQGKVIGLDLVEVAPDYDLTNSTSTLAAQLLMNVISRILYNS